MDVLQELSEYNKQNWGGMFGDDVIFFQYTLNNGDVQKVKDELQRRYTIRAIKAYQQGGTVLPGEPNGSDFTPVIENKDSDIVTLDEVEVTPKNNMGAKIFFGGILLLGAIAIARR